MNNLHHNLVHSCNNLVSIVIGIVVPAGTLVAPKLGTKQFIKLAKHSKLKTFFIISPHNLSTF